MGSHQKKNKPAVVNGNSSDSTDAAITGSNNPLTMSNQATVMAPMAGGMEPAVNLVAAAHGGMFQGPHKSMVANYLLNKGGKVQAMVSPGEVYLSPEKVDRVIRNGEDPVKVGEKFKGKAKVKGDSLKNDILPKTLETGGVVIDREHMDTAEKRKKFVQKTVAKKRAQR
jgi:hypothetical protein